MAGARVTLAPMRPALVLAENRLAGREQPCGIDRMILVYRNRRAFALIEWADPDSSAAVLRYSMGKPVLMRCLRIVSTTSRIASGPLAYGTAYSISLKRIVRGLGRIS